MLADRPTQDLERVVGSVLHDPLWFYWVEHGDDRFVVCARSVDEVHAVVQERVQLRLSKLGGACMLTARLCVLTPRLCVTRVASLVLE